jgi:hypothetical protein
MPELLYPSLQLLSIFPLASKLQEAQDLSYASAAQPAKEEPTNNPNNISTNMIFMRL